MAKRQDGYKSAARKNTSTPVPTSDTTTKCLWRLSAPPHTRQTRYKVTRTEQTKTHNLRRNHVSLLVGPGFSTPTITKHVNFKGMQNTLARRHCVSVDGVLIFLAESDDLLTINFEALVVLASFPIIGRIACHLIQAVEKIATPVLKFLISRISNHMQLIRGNRKQRSR